MYPLRCLETKLCYAYPMSVVFFVECHTTINELNLPQIPGVLTEIAKMYRQRTCRRNRKPRRKLFIQAVNSIPASSSSSSGSQKCISYYWCAMSSRRDGNTEPICWSALAVIDCNDNKTREYGMNVNKMFSSEVWSPPPPRKKDTKKRGRIVLSCPSGSRIERRDGVN